MGEIESLTILKYALDGTFLFHVMDKFDEPDEPTRLDKMIQFAATLEAVHGEAYTEVWIKTCPIFPTR
jgi:hypothetical protein